MTQAGCPLCEAEGGPLIFKNEQLRVIQAQEEGFPAFYRVVWNSHVVEFSDLTDAERLTCMNTVASVEKTLRQQLQPSKINLASLGNAVPHLHWHVVARFDWDSHFPEPIWGQSQREVLPAPVERLAISLSDLDEAVRASLCAPAPPFLS